MLIFRTMEVDADGKPRAGEASNQLGLRPADPANPTKQPDTRAARPTDPVAPTEGLSATPDTPFAMPPFLKRKGQRPGFAVWVLDTATLPPGLHFHRDQPTHGVIAPAAVEPLAVVQDMLRSTRDSWLVVEWNQFPPTEGEVTP
jgi:hypothetical protein